jgi:hypothetical protein
LCNDRRHTSHYTSDDNGEGKAVSLQAWGGLEGSRKLRFPDILTTAQDGGKVVSLTHRPHLLPGNTPGTHFSDDIAVIKLRRMRWVGHVLRTGDLVIESRISVRKYSYTFGRVILGEIYRM